MTTFESKLGKSFFVGTWTIGTNNFSLINDEKYGGTFVRVVSRLYPGEINRSYLIGIPPTSIFEPNVIEILFKLVSSIFPRISSNHWQRKLIISCLIIGWNDSKIHDWNENADRRKQSRTQWNRYKNYNNVEELRDVSFPSARRARKIRINSYSNQTFFLSCGRRTFLDSCCQIRLRFAPTRGAKRRENSAKLAAMYVA